MFTKLLRLLKRAGGTHLPCDITTAIAQHEMQSWTLNESWVVTRIALYPRKKVVEIVIYIGERKDLDSLYQRVVEFAQEVGADSLRSVARLGWDDEYVRSFGFKPIGILYERDFKDGRPEHTADAAAADVADAASRVGVAGR